MDTASNFEASLRLAQLLGDLVQTLPQHHHSFWPKNQQQALWDELHLNVYKPFKDCPDLQCPKTIEGTRDYILDQTPELSPGALRALIVSAHNITGQINKCYTLREKDNHGGIMILEFLNDALLNMHHMRFVGLRQCGELAENQCFVALPTSRYFPDQKARQQDQLNRLYTDTPQLFADLFRKARIRANKPADTENAIFGGNAQESADLITRIYIDQRFSTNGR